MQMFRSARLKLTLFYLAILLGFSLTLTLAFRTAADSEFGHATRDQRQVVRQIFLDYLDRGEIGSPSNSYQSAQDDEASAWRVHLDRDLALVNIYAILIGGLLSYWFADRTLKPIEEAHEAQQRFVADASHELRTPLTSLQLENELFLRQKKFDADEAKTLITSNLEEVQRLHQLSSTLLDLTQYGHAALKRGPVGVKHVVEAAVRQAHPVAEQKGVTMQETVAEATVVGHHDSLVQLLGILLDNALKYGAPNGVVQVRGQRHGGQYVLQVIDDGMGISADDLPHIFERLYRGDKARSNKTGGYGLGLSLGQEIAHANHSQITARNNLDGGACFELRLEIA